MNAEVFLKIIKKIIPKKRKEPIFGLQEIQIIGLEQQHALSDLRGDKKIIEQKLQELASQEHKAGSSLDLYILRVYQGSSPQGLIMGPGGDTRATNETLRCVLDQMSDTR